MTDEQFNLMMSVLADIRSELQTLNQSVRGRQSAPSYQYPLNRYAHFDWSTIGAEAIECDNDGAIAVQWNQRTYTRRSPQNKFEPAIWFSRSLGEDSEGKAQYERLITFKDTAGADPLPAKVSQALQVQQTPAMNGHGARSQPASAGQDNLATFRAVCAALGIGADAVKRCYGKALQALNLPRTKCNALADEQFAAVCDRVLIDWALGHDAFSSEGDAIATLTQLKKTLQNFTALELAQHWATFAPSMSA